MTAYALIVTAIAMAGVLVAVLLFERKRAEQIEQDLGKHKRHRNG